MQVDEKVIEQFAIRRSATWRACRLWLMVLVVSGGYFGISLSHGSGDVSLGMLLALTLVFSSGIAVLMAVGRHYRCPKCNKVPMRGSVSAGLSGSVSFNRRVDFSPEECPNCGARLAQLRPNPSLERP
jgi:hypothetical protein